MLSPGQTDLPTQANSSQVHNFDWVGYRLAAHLARVGLNLIKLKVSPNSSHLSQLSPSCFVIVIIGIVWPPGDASFDFVTWLELGVPFGQGFTSVTAIFHLATACCTKWTGFYSVQHSCRCSQHGGRAHNVITWSAVQARLHFCATGRKRMLLLLLRLDANAKRRVL